MKLRGNSRVNSWIRVSSGEVLALASMGGFGSFRLVPLLPTHPLSHSEIAQEVSLRKRSRNEY